MFEYPIAFINREREKAMVEIDTKDGVVVNGWTVTRVGNVHRLTNRAGDSFSTSDVDFSENVPADVVNFLREVA